MSGIDILLERACVDHELSEAVATALRVRSSTVLVIHDVSEYLQTHRDQVVCLVHNFPEGFRHLAAIDSCTEFSVDEFARRLASALGTRCLVPADGPNPYAMVLYSKKGREGVVYLNALALDNKGIHVLDT